MSEIALSDDKALLDVDRIHGWLASSYWSPDIERVRLEKAIANSHCLGAYRDGGQIGFARMVTDYASFAWLADVWVDESARGHGLARRMTRWFLDHPEFQGIRRMGLATLDAHGVYEAVGFRPLMRPDRLMERLDPAYVARLESGRS